MMLNPVLRYAAYSLIDFAGLSSIFPVTIQEFQKHVNLSSTNVAHILSKYWLTDACFIISDQKDSIEKLMPLDDPVATHFYFDA